MAVLLVATGIRQPEATRWAALVALFAVPIASAFPLLQSQNYNYDAYLVGFAGLVAAVVVVSRRAVPLNPGVAFLTYVLISAFAFVGPGHLISSYQTFIFPIGALSLYLLTITSPASAPLRIVRLFLAYSAVEAGLGIVQSLTGSPVLFNQHHFVSNRNPLGYILSSVSKSVQQGLGTFQHPNGLGCMMALAFPLALGLWLPAKRSPVRCALLVLVGAGLWTTYSRGAWLGALVGIGVLGLARSSRLRRTKLIVIATAACVIVAAGSGTLRSYYSGSQNLTARLNTWEEAKYLAEAKPSNLVFGYGYSFFQVHNETVGVKDSTRGMVSAHSWPVQAVIELGSVGLALLLLFMVPPLVRGLRRPTGELDLPLVGAITAFLVSQLVDNALFGFTGIPMFVLLAALQVLQRSQRDQTLTNRTP